MVEKSKNEFFEAILNEHKGIFLKVAKAYCKDQDDRKDLLQEMMVQVWTSLHRYDDDFKLSTWLYRVVLNVAISYHRKNDSRQKYSQTIDLEKTEVADTDENEVEPKLALLDKFINELNDLDKALMVLFLEEKSHLEISEILGISTSNVSTKILRIKEKLKQKFQKN
jgi:RNA polymerase sigma factor (sigma-70 family)